jgi:Na+/proline symporter
MNGCLVNIIALLIIASPSMLVEHFKDKSKWVDDHEAALMIGGWILALIIVWVVFLPAVGGKPNPRVFTDMMQ